MALSLLKDRCSALEERIPRYQHIVTNSKYNARLAKTQLLGSDVARRVVPALTNNVFHLAASISKAMPALGFDPEDSCELQSAQGVVDLANETLAVLAGVSAVEELTGAEGVAMASKLLQKKGILL